LGIGDWAQSPIPNPQSPIPNPQEKILKNIYFLSIVVLRLIIKYILFNKNIYDNGI
jgi:hypothetical protein